MSTMEGLRAAELDTPSVGRKRRRGWMFGAALAVLAVTVVGVIASPFLQEAATRQDILSSLLPAGSPGHPLGTDGLGRDVLLMTLAGTASSVVGPVCIALGSMVLGVLWGSIAGYLRGPADFIIGRTTDLLLSLPVMLVALVVAGLLGSGYWVTVFMLMVLFSPSDIRLVRAGYLEQSALPYVEAGRMLSLPAPVIMYRHILPNILPVALTNLMLNTAIALVTLSSLSFLGIGVAPGTPDWGRQITDSRQFLMDNPAGMVVPAVLIILVAWAVTVVGDRWGERLAGREEAS